MPGFQENAYGFRKAGMQDIEALIKARASLIACFGARSEDIRTDAANYRQYVLESLADGSFIFWLAELDKKIAATGSVSFYRLAPTRRRPNGKVAYIGNMFTYVSHRHQGLASEILRHLLEDARAAGCHAIQLHASSDGLPLYEKCGFALTSDVMEMHLP